MIEIEAPDGTVIEFPDGTPDEVIEKAMQAEYGAPEPQLPQDFVNQVGGGHSFFNGIPIAGPFVADGLNRVGAAVDSFGSQVGLNPHSEGPLSFDEALQKREQAVEQFRGDNPWTTTGIEMVGGAVATAPLAATALGAKALGLTGESVLARTGAGALSGAALGGADTAARGGDIQDIAIGAGIGGGVGGALPVVGKTIDTVIDTAKSTLAPKRTAQGKVLSAFQDDAAVGDVMRGGDITAATRNNQPMLAGDFGGENMRGLARSAANQSPTARGALQAAVGDRFETQGNRAIDFVSDLVDGATDDVGLQEMMLNRARQSAKVDYERAYKFNFGNKDTTNLAQLVRRVPAEAIRNATRIAKAEGREFGEQLVASIDGDVIRFAREPSFRELDYIQRGLRGSTDAAFRSGVGEVGTAYKSLHKQILQEMDTINPFYAKARGDYSAFKGADNALDAGKAAATTRRKNSELVRDFGKLKDREKEVFRVGFASELIDMIKSRGDNQDVVKGVFGNQEMREKINIILGSKKAREVEAFARIEKGMNLFRQKVIGNSTTAQQMTELPNSSSTMYGTIRAAIQNTVNKKMADEIANTLVSRDPQAIQKLVRQAATNQGTRKAVEQFYQLAGAGLIGATVAGQ